MVFPRERTPMREKKKLKKQQRLATRKECTRPTEPKNEAIDNEPLTKTSESNGEPTRDRVHSELASLFTDRKKEKKD